MRISTRSPCLRTRSASNDAHDGLGDSLVPLRASVKIETLRSGFDCSAVSIVATSSCSAFPIYSVDRYTRLCAFNILFCDDHRQSKTLSHLAQELRHTFKV